MATSDSSLTVEELCQMMNSFVEAAEAGNHRDLGWPSNTYIVSKVGLSALSRIQQRQFDQDDRKVWALELFGQGSVSVSLVTP